MIGVGSLAHNRRDFVAENVNPDRVQLNICYKNENLKEVYASVAKLGKNENVTTDVLVKICTALKCDISDIMEIIEIEREKA